MIWAFDIATRCTGWCVGDGSTLPRAGFFKYDWVGADLGALAIAWERDRNALVDRFGMPTVVCYEAPLLLPSDKLLTLRKIYGMGFDLERWCTRRGIPCCETSPASIKKRIAGSHKASKDDVVHAVSKRLRITLPPGDEKKDVADAIGCWITAGVDFYAKQHRARWDQALYSTGGFR